MARPIVKFDSVPIQDRQMLRAAEVGTLFFGVSGNNWRKWHRDGWTPKPVVFLGNRFLWRRIELLDWIAAGCPQESLWRWEPSKLGIYESLIQERQAELGEIKDEIMALRKVRGGL